MIILSTLGSHGDLYPFLKLAEILKSQGKEVMLVTSDAFAEKIQKKGFKFHSIMTLSEHKGLVDETCGDGMFGEYQYQRYYILIAQRLITLYTEIKNSIDVELFITNFMPSFGAKILEEAYGVPFIQTQLTPFTVPTKYPFRMNGLTEKDQNLLLELVRKIYLVCWRLFRYYTLSKPLDRIRKKVGIKHRMSSTDPLQWLGQGSKNMALFPKFFVNPLPSDWPLENAEHLGFPLYDPNSTEKLPKELSKFLQNPSKTILFTRSTIYRGIHDEHKKFFKDAVAICEKLNCQGLFVHLFPENIPDNLPDNIFYTDFTCYDTVFPLVDCIVHQGGIGTVAQAIKHGKPQLVVPLIFDQFANGDFVHNLGIGSTVNYNELTVESAVSILQDFLNNERYQKKCHKASEQTVASNADFFDAVGKIVDNSINIRNRDAI